MSDEQEPIPPVEIPVDSLSSDLLDAVIESFVLREGTDYGAEEVSLMRKILQVRSQIEEGDVKIIFDMATESVALMTKTEFLKTK